MRILVVEDDATLSAQLESGLKDAGYRAIAKAVPVASGYARRS